MWRIKHLHSEKGVCMRSCIYCGKELEKGEVCTCPQSLAHRQSNKKSSDVNKEENKNTNYSNPYKTENSYKTGYSGTGSRFERAKIKRNARKATRQRSKTTQGHTRTFNAKGFLGKLWNYIIRFIKSPIDTIANPPHLGKGSVLTLAALQGIVLWLCMFFILRGGGVGPIKLLASLMGIGMGYNLIGKLILCMLSGAISGIVLFVLYSGIFWLINKFIMKLQSAYWEFSIRLVSAWIPFTVICTIGVLLSMLSSMTLLTMLLCGAVSVAVLTYEALRTEWISKSPSQVLYAMLLGYFVFFSVVCCLIIL